MSLGIVMVPSSPVVQVVQTTVIVQGCSFYQLQCWAFPLMFMGMFMGFFIGVGSAFRVSEKAYIYLLLSGLTYASLVEIQLGIMTPMVPILLIAANIAYSLRLDRLIFPAGDKA